MHWLTPEIRSEFKFYTLFRSSGHMFGVVYYSMLLENIDISWWNGHFYTFYGWPNYIIAYNLTASKDIGIIFLSDMAAYLGHSLPSSE